MWENNIALINIALKCIKTVSLSVWHMLVQVTNQWYGSQMFSSNKY